MTKLKKLKQVFIPVNLTYFKSCGTTHLKIERDKYLLSEAELKEIISNACDINFIDNVEKSKDEYIKKILN